MPIKCRVRLSRVFLAGALGLTAPAAAQTGWNANGGDAANTRYSGLAQIKPVNVATLVPAWTWDSGEISGEFEVAPLVIGHVMYVSTPRERVVALDADSGKEIWNFDPKLSNLGTHRGVSYWPGDAHNPARIVAATSNGRIYALDATTGAPSEDFGDHGVVDLRAGFGPQYANVLYGFTSPPAVYKNLIIFGPRTAEGGPKGPDASIRALDVRTGRQVWTFHTLPRPGEPGYETWGPNFWRDGGGGPSAWAGLTLDLTTGLVFVPVGNPTGGGDPAGRKGSNLYSNSVVALNADTGKLVWYYQMVHHDVWDYDVTASPTLITVMRDGKKIPALAQMTKQALLFILDRRTGKPVFGVEERATPASKTPGEDLSPTQPFPVKPVALAKNSMSAADVSHISQEAQTYCGSLLASHEFGGPFPARDNNGAITFPSSIGGGNWGGVSFDPALGLIFANTSNLGALSNGPRGAAPAPGAPAAPRAAGGNRFVDQDHYPCNQPPWGQLTAINANTGDIAWQVPLGSYKALEDKGIKDTGTVNTGPSLVTAGGVLFIGATNDQRFRAFDAKTGKQIWQTDMPGNALAQPITYLNAGGKQMLVVATGGPSLMGGVGPAPAAVNGELTAYKLPR